MCTGFELADESGELVRCHRRRPLGEPDEVDEADRVAVLEALFGGDHRVPRTLVRLHQVAAQNRIERVGETIHQARGFVAHLRDLEVVVARGQHSSLDIAHEQRDRRLTKPIQRGPDHPNERQGILVGEHLGDGVEPGEQLGLRAREAEAVVGRPLESLEAEGVGVSVEVLFVHCRDLERLRLAEDRAAEHALVRGEGRKLAEGVGLLHGRDRDPQGFEPAEQLQTARAIVLRRDVQTRSLELGL